MSLRKFLTSLTTKRQNPQAIMRDFERSKDQLQQAFFDMASASGKPRGLRWVGCEWLSPFALVHDPSEDLYTLFCQVNLRFEAVEGGDMEGVEAVSTVRDGSAVFHYRAGRWGTGGRVLFNMVPQMAASSAAAGQQLLLDGE